MMIFCNKITYIPKCWICILGFAMMLACQPGEGYSEKSDESAEPYIMTVLGPVEVDSLGMTLSHEHIMVDFIGADSVSKDRYHPDSVIEKALPYLEQLKERGGNALFECTPAYLGRDAVILRRLSEKTGIHIITNTGYYGTRKGIFLPNHVQTETAEELAGRWIAEWENGIEGTGIRPGFIKISVNPDTFTVIDEKIVEAAAITHLETGLTMGSHTTSGPSVMKILEILERKEVKPNAFIWIHAQTVPDSTYHQQVAEAGAWIEFDGVRPNDRMQQSVHDHVNWVMMMHRWGRLDQVLVSHDAGWYHVGEPGGGNFRSFETVFTRLIPELKKQGMQEEDIQTIFVDNPARAFALR